MRRRDGVLDDRPAGNLDQLFRNVQADASPGASSQNHRNIAQSRHRLNPIARLSVVGSVASDRAPPC